MNEHWKFAIKWRVLYNARTRKGTEGHTIMLQVRCCASTRSQIVCHICVSAVQRLIAAAREPGRQARRALMRLLCGQP